MAKSDLSCERLRGLGAQLRTVRKAAGLTQAQVCLGLGMKGVSTRSYLHRLEKGELNNVAFMTVVRYLQACKVPIGKFMLELVQSGAFGEAEAEGVRESVTGFTSQKLRGETCDGETSNEEKRAKAKLLYQKRWERETEDANIIAGIWREVQVAIQPLLPADDPTRRFLAPYLEGVRLMYRAWKQATRGAVNKNPTLDVEIAFDRIERAGLERLVPAAVRKAREIVFRRLMEKMPLGGKL